MSTVLQQGETQVKIKRGDPFSRTYSVTNQTDGSPALARFGQSFKSYLRRSADGPLDAVFTVVTDLDAGTLTLSLTSAQTRTLNAPEYVWDVRGYDSEGNPLKVFLGGTAEISKDVTHD